MTMTDTIDEPRLVQAIEVIDDHLRELDGRTIYSVDEIRNLLLDLRLLLHPSNQ